MSIKLEHLPWDELKKVGDYFIVKSRHIGPVSIACHHQTHARKLKFKSLTVDSEKVMVLLVGGQNLTYRKIVPLTLNSTDESELSDKIPF